MIKRDILEFNNNDRGNLISWPRKCCLCITHAVSNITDILNIRRLWSSFVGFLTCASYNKSILSVPIQILSFIKITSRIKNITLYRNIDQISKNDSDLF